MVSENTMLKGRLCTVQETLSTSELESKASRETINRLVSEVNHEQSIVSKYKQEMDHLQRVSDGTVTYLSLIGKLTRLRII